MKNKSIPFGFVIFVMAFFVITSCTKETTPPPSASFTTIVEGKVVTFADEVTNYNKFEWDFNNGSYIYTIPNPVRTFPDYGKDNNDRRRTGLPDIEKNSDLAMGDYPFTCRYRYLQTEMNNNLEKYQEAIGRLTGATQNFQKCSYQSNS